MKSIRCLIAPAGLAFLLAACHRESPPYAREPLSPAAVRVQTAALQHQWLTEDVLGSVRARTRAVVEAQVSGRIESMPIKLGQQVESGEVLLRLAAPEISARLDQAQAMLEQAAKELQRYQRLLQEEAVTRQEYDRVLGRFQVAEASVREAQTMVSYTEIRAPFPGLVTRKHADVGDLAQPGRPLLELEGLTNFQFEANVPEVLLKNITVGDLLTVSIDSLAEDYSGTVSEIAPAAEANTRTFPVQLNLPHLETLRAGQFGRVAVPVKQVEMLLVPRAALISKGQLEMVYVVNPDGHPPRAEMRLVKTGRHRDTSAEVLSGLQPGEVMVVEGVETVRDGQPLDLLP